MPRIHKREDEQAFAADLVARGWVSVARRRGEVVGFLARDGAEVVALYVAREARGQGVGSALLARAKRRSPGSRSGPSSSTTPRGASTRPTGFASRPHRRRGQRRETARHPLPWERGA
jgi:GNAT superfamily N-acetyltransferase